MADNEILKQIALLNPRIINGNEIDSVNDFIVNSDASSPVEDTVIESHNIEEENDILNLWSSKDILFDPFDPSKIKTSQAFNNNNILQTSTSNTNTTTQELMNSIISTSIGNNSKLNTSLNQMSFQIGLDNNDKGSNDKGNDLYSQLLNSINSGKKNSKKESDTIYSKTNDCRNKEIAEKKKRRSAATMRCRERKKNQLQKKEQYIKYLENQNLFLNGSILHMKNEINWLRRSFLDQYGEQSLKNIYMKNGFKDVNFNNILYPGSTSSPTSFTSSTTMMSPNLNMNGNSNVNIDQSPKQSKSCTLLPQDSTFLTPTSSAPTNTNNILSRYSPPLSSNEKITNNITNTSVSPQKIPSLIQKSPISCNSTNVNSKFISSNNLTSQPTFSNLNNKTVINNTSVNDLFNHLDMTTLNEFANLSKEQRDVLLKILEKQRELYNDERSEELSVTSASSRNFINIAHNNESQSQLSKPPNSLLNLVPTNNSITNPTDTTQFNPLLTSNLLNTFNRHNGINSLSFNSNSIAVSASQTSNGQVPSLQTSITLSNSNPNLLTSFNEQTKKETPSNIITTTNADSQNSNYINLENLIYYI
ncbi:hypothetical protein BCR36DRAFT_588181 [Piromyces finnis]|uniref:BZIP domain-containing protein n=1 Tax=Piromyces finnis TaxID=1754191 RepID=A0A1Y1UQW4_9FUNG|nr:hypothetical protein BCR36DRAFT_588181 [Piromyces finnis]|eukprot:ORX40379.1 hypothetical protein BCR36DRAFT_588181 [Piromyces finnis]